jgi:agmatine deiminase
MPAEYSAHDGTIMIFPVRPGSWGKDRTGTLKSFGQIFLEILRRENLYLLAGKSHWMEAKDFIDSLIAHNSADKKEAELLENRCLIFPIDSDDAWARDVGPTFVVNRDESFVGNNIRGINWSFNAWGGEVDGLYASWEKDDKVAEKFCDICNIDFYDAAPFVLEGGSIHCDGEGTVMVTESCLLSAGRNPSLTKQQIEDNLKKYLGAEKVLWLPRGIYNDETNEHVDNVCAFVEPSQVVLAWTDNVNDPQYELSKACLEYLEKETDARGRKLTVHLLPIPDHPVLVKNEDLMNYEFEEGEDVREVGERLAASYVNFYFINGAALVPQFGGDNKKSDERALDILQEICPDREIIGIPARDILLGGGNIHCITQQIPDNNL